MEIALTKLWLCSQRNFNLTLITVDTNGYSSNIHVQQLHDWLWETVQGIDTDMLHKYMKLLTDNMITSISILANADNAALDHIFHRNHLPLIKKALLKLQVSIYIFQ